MRKPGSGVSHILYLIQSENGLTKIGIASDVNDRLKTLNIGSPVVIVLIYHVYTIFAKEIETELHAMYKDKLVKGEWHKLTDEDIQNIQSKYGENGTISEYEIVA